MKTYRKEWTAVINKTKYDLTDQQAEVVKNAIACNSKGIIMFKEFSLPMAYLQEFYQESKSRETIEGLPDCVLRLDGDTKLKDEGASKRIEEIKTKTREMLLKKKML